MGQPNNRGGYQAPQKPAMVSGPGKYSQRTDGQPKAQLPDAAYGEQKTYQQQQSGAPMAQAGTGLSNPGPAPADLSRVTPMGAPSQFPGEPVTAGADGGAGPSAGILGLGQQPLNDQGFAEVAQILPTLELMATSPMATDEFRAFVREVYARS
jgi:hypothetical protein